MVVTPASIIRDGMTICVTPEDLARNPRERFGGRLLEMFGDRSVPGEGPLGHIFRQRPNGTNLPHFHESDQYQIFIAGDGRLGGHEVRPGSVHYSDAYSGYGPIVANAAGLSYVTLRTTFDISHHPLPQDAGLARGRKGQQHLGHMDLGGDLREGVTTLFKRPDGVAAYQVNLATRRPAPEIARVGGSFWLVLKGDVVVDGRPCRAGSCAWVGEEDVMPAISAGEHGAVIAVACFADAHSQAARRMKVA